MSWIKTTLVVISIFISSAFAQAQQAQPEKEWTFLIFLNGHNNLSSFGDMNIKDMEKVGSSKDLNIIVEWGSAETATTKRLYVEKSTDPTKVTSKSVLEMQNYDMGSYTNLQSFIDWGVDHYPAKHYFIAVWNHGSGWHKNLLMDFGKPAVIKDISYDETSGNHITTEQLGGVIANAKTKIGHNVDIYGSDACLMQMIEVANEMKDSVDYFSGSQETEPGEGWPYLPFLQKWSAAPMMSPRDVSILLSKEYLAAYRTGGVYGEKSGITFGALDMSKLDAMNAAVSELGKKLSSLNATDFSKIKSVALVTTRFAVDDYADIGDFSNRLRDAKIASIKSSLLDDVDQKLHDLVLSSDNDPNVLAHGLSIWLPMYKDFENVNQPRYDKLKFSISTGWNIFTNKLAN